MSTGNAIRNKAPINIIINKNDALPDCCWTSIKRPLDYFHETFSRRQIYFDKTVKIADDIEAITVRLCRIRTRCRLHTES